MKKMLRARPYVPSSRIAVRADSIDEEASDDVEDDVFIRDGRYVKLNDDENGLKLPLMPPKRRNGKQIVSVPIMKRHRRCWKCCEPFCYGLAALTILITLIFLAAFILTVFPIPIQKIKVWLKTDKTSTSGVYQTTPATNVGTEFVPCTQINVEKVWTKTFPRVNSESAIRSIDLNGDGVKDIVFGYGIDETITDVRLPKCQTAQGDTEITCGGGVYALNGRSGEIIWQKWTIASVFSLVCSVDIDKDGLDDCIAAGEGGMIMAISGNKGTTIWNFKELHIETNSPIVTDLYTINPIRDLNGDDVPDILASHIEERSSSKSGHIKLISGKTGTVIRSIPTPFREEMFAPMQIFTQIDGTELLIITTGGQDTSGGIYSTRLMSMMKYTSDKDFNVIYKKDNSGFMTPAIFTDVNNDSFPDIVMSAFNSTVYAFDGRTFAMIWNYTFPSSESVSEIVPGHFNHDNVTDFMVKYSYGPGYPIYYYSQTTILDGLTGHPILQSMMTDSGGPSSLLAGMSISQTNGGDFFLHWQMQCRGKYDAKDAYEFVPDSDIWSQSRADVCMLRYNTSTVLKLYAIARHIEPPGAVLFSSDDVEVHLNKTNRENNSKSPQKHPKMTKKLNNYILQESESFPNKVNKSVKKGKLIEGGERLEDGYEDLKHYLYPTNFRQKPNSALDNVGKFEDEDYEYGEDRNEIMNERPIHLRGKYPGARGIRSDTEYLSPNVTDEPLNLWDLEIEKEEKEAQNDYISRKKRNPDNPEHLASIYSTGLLLESFQKNYSSIDYVFILNVRESETYPPLLLPQDLNCIEEKLQAYKSLSTAELMSLKKQSISACLKERLTDNSPVTPQYESQMIVVRTSIKCKCRILEKGEVCSKFNSMDQQKWTSFMGKDGYGVY